MKRLFSLLSLLLLLNALSCTADKQEGKIQIIPLPNQIQWHKGHTPFEEKRIDSITNPQLPEEGYRLQIRDGKIRMEASSSAGFFYARQTLLQLKENSADGKLQNLSIEDCPRYSWRGMHLDVSRYFFDIDFIKKQMDAMARYKLNRFHWHLTDGTGWRLEIPAYPRLTEYGAWRTCHSWKEWWFSEERAYCTQDQPGAYGGYYTAEDVREVLEYARQRHITVIPEIEFPGHSEEVLVCYPELKCRQIDPEKGSKYPSDLCAAHSLTYQFIDEVLSYVLELFPSEYIHIGGDEVAKTQWKNCPDCQALMRREGMQEEGELQDHIIRHIERFLKDHGRKMIGWDEIYKEQLDSTSIVMAWRSEKIGHEAALKGNQVIMAPGAYCYLNNYQADPETQPEAIGGYLLLEKVYSFDPGQTADRILGIQSCLWSEYLPDEKIAEYMLYPRLLAIAENAWTLPQHKFWEDFKIRANEEIHRLRQRGYQAYTLSPTPFVSQEIRDSCMYIELYSERHPVEIRYTLDGSIPDSQSTLYTKPIQVSDSIHLCAALFENGKMNPAPLHKSFYFHKAFGKKVSYQKRIYPDYSAAGEATLTDGLIGGKGYQDGRWQGFCPNDLSIIIDLEHAMEFQSVRANFMQVTGPYIFLPVKTEVYISDDGKEFRLLGTECNTLPQDAEGVIFREMGWKGSPVRARYIQLKAYQNKIKGFLFTDEVIVL